MYILKGNSRETLRGTDAGSDYYLVDLKNNTTVMLSTVFGYSDKEDGGAVSDVRDPSLDSSMLTFTGVTYADMLKVQDKGKEAIGKNIEIFSKIVASASEESVLVNLSDFKVDSKAPSKRSPAKRVKPESTPDQPVDEA